MATPKSIAQLVEMINNADVNMQGLVDWIGENGLENSLLSIISTLGARGILSFNSTSQMAMAGGGDSGYAVCPDNDGVLLLYKFYPNIDNTIVGGVTSTSAGQWRPVISVAAIDTVERITLGLSLTVTISNTGKDVVFPSAVSNTNYVVMIQPTNTYTANFQATIGYFVDNKTTSGFQIRFNSPAVANGTFSADCLVIF